MNVSCKFQLSNETVCFRSAIHVSYRYVCIMLHSYNDDKLMINSYNRVFKKVGQEWPIILCLCLHLLRTSSTRSIVISFFPELSKEVIMQNFLLPKILDKNSLPLCHSCWSEWRPEQECFVSEYVNIS